MKVQIGEWIKELRRRRNLKQYELAESVELSVRHLQKIESGGVDLNCSTLFKFSNPLSVPACFLLADRSGETSFMKEHFGCTSQILDKLHVGIAVVDTNGTIVYANKTHLKALGIDASILKSQNPSVWDTFYDSADLSAAREYLANLLKTRPPPSPYYMKFKSLGGSLPLPAKIDWSYLFDKKDNISGFLCVIIYHHGW